MAKKKRTTRSLSKSSRKATRTRKSTVSRKATKRKATKRKATTRKRVTRKKQSAESFGWEMVPFVVAVIVAIVVVMQSVDSAQDQRGTNTFSILPAPRHMAADCMLDGATLRGILSAERGAERARLHLASAQDLLSWDCTIDPQSATCEEARTARKRAEDILRVKLQEIQALTVEACI